MKLPFLRSFSTFFFANGAATFVIIALVFVCGHVNLWLKRVLTLTVKQNIDIKNCGCELLFEELNNFLYYWLSFHFTNSFYLRSLTPHFTPSFLCSVVFTWFTQLSICSTKLSAIKHAFYIFTMFCDEWDLLLMLSLIEHFVAWWFRWHSINNSTSHVPQRPHMHIPHLNWKTCYSHTKCPILPRKCLIGFHHHIWKQR